MTGIVDEGPWAVGAIYFNFSKTLQHCLSKYSCIEVRMLQSECVDTMMGDQLIHWRAETYIDWSNGPTGTLNWEMKCKVLTPLKEELQPYNEISVIITGLWLSQGILTTLLSAGRTTPQSTTNSGGFWGALANTGRWCVGHHTCKQGRSGWGCEGWEQPWLQRPWNGGAQVPESGARQKQITAPDLRRTDFFLTFFQTFFPDFFPFSSVWKKNLMGYSPTAKGDLCGWIRNLNIKRRCTRDGRRDKWPGRDIQA